MNVKVQLLILLVTASFQLASQSIGNASYYSSKLQGRRVSDGSKYHPDSLTCAHRTAEFGTLFWVRNLKNGNSTVVKVTDRGPHGRGRIIDLSFRAAKELGMITDGITKVEITPIDHWPEAVRKLVIPEHYLETDTITPFTIQLPGIKSK